MKFASFFTQRNALLISCLFAFGFTAVQAADPVVANVQAAQRPGTKLVDITFEVADADNDLVNISINVSDDAGATFNVPSTALSGDISINAIATPTSHAVVWDAGVDFNQQFNPNMVVRVIADGGSDLGPAPPGMALIPAGTFLMGDQWGMGNKHELPVHEVYVSAFYMDKFEVTLELWQEVSTWAVTNGYEFRLGNNGHGARHPAYTMLWYDAVKWCNARSEKEGLTPVYRLITNINPPVYAIYRTGEIDLANNSQNWTANGYRLPTEAEWEKAARGTRVGNVYPWGNVCKSWYANYNYSGDPFENENTDPFTTPVGFYDGKQWRFFSEDMANGYGLYDMSGNIKEWCWDWYDSYGSGPFTDPRGPLSGDSRVVRGGSWASDPTSLRCADRSGALPGLNSPGLPPYPDREVGFRCVKGR